MLKPTRLMAFLSVFVAFSFCFSASAAPLVATAPNLGTATAFGVLAASTVTNTGDSVVDGDLGVSPGTAVTGFPPGIVNGTIHAGDAVAAQAQSDVTVAYNDLASQACDTTYPTGTQDLGGLTLIPGVYCADAFALTGTLTLQGGAADVWIFKSAATLITATDAQVNVSGGALSCNVWWQVGSSATLGTNTAFRGNILSLASITLNTGASMFGAALARTGAVTMDTNNIDICFGPNAVALQEFQASSGTDIPLGLGAGAALLLALGLIVVARRGLAPADAMRSAKRRRSE
jgi:hypothetical protein